MAAGELLRQDRAGVLAARDRADPRHRRRRLAGPGSGAGSARPWPRDRHPGHAGRVACGPCAAPPCCRPRGRARLVRAGRGAGLLSADRPRPRRPRSPADGRLPARGRGSAGAARATRRRRAARRSPRCSACARRGASCSCGSTGCSGRTATRASRASPARRRLRRAPACGASSRSATTRRRARGRHRGLAEYVRAAVRSRRDAPWSRCR